MDNTHRRSKRLGKGLSALIPDINEQFDKKDIVQVKLKDIRPNKNQPRKKFNEDRIKSLSNSIKNVGVLQPIVLKPIEDNNYMIIAGERRFKASIMAGKEEIPAIIKDIPIKDIMEIALIENLQREDLNAIEEALAYKNLIENYKVTQEELSEVVGKSRPHITNTLRLLNLQKKVINMVESGCITPGHGKTLLRIENYDLQLELANRIVKEGLSVRALEEIVKKIIAKKEVKKSEKTQKDIYLIDVEEKLSNIFGTKVNISNGKNKGKIEIVYNNEDELNEILSMIINED